MKPKNLSTLSRALPRRALVYARRAALITAITGTLSLYGCNTDETDANAAQPGDTPISVASPSDTSTSDASSSSNASSSDTNSGPSQSTTNFGPGATRVLLVSLDGVGYDAIQAGLANGSLPNLAKLNISLAYGGGVAGTTTQQTNTITPAWATLLTGNWVNRHGVALDSQSQSIKTSTVLDAIKAGTSGLSGAVAASPEVIGLMTPAHDAGTLDKLYDCSSSTTAADCVTQQAGALINGDYATILAQYHSAADIAAIQGVGSAQYASAIKTLDTDLGILLQKAAAHNPNDKWLVVVTSSYGVNANGVMDGLPLLPESTTFIGVNQPLNNTAGVGAAVPAQLAGLYAYPSIADVTPTVLSYLGLMPSAANYAMDGGELISDQPVQALSVTLNVSNVNLPDPSATLNWTAPEQGDITVLRDGQVIATLPAGATSYIDNDIRQYMVGLLPNGGTHQINYAVQAGTGTALRANLTAPISYSALATTVKNGLLAYFPFSNAAQPAADSENNSVMAPPQSDMPANAGTMVADSPFGADSKSLLIDTSQRDASNYEGYKITFNSTNSSNPLGTSLDPTNTATPTFTVGFWFKQSTCITTNDVPILGNKNYVSGAYAGFQIGEFTNCTLAFNLGSGTGDPTMTGSGIATNATTGPSTTRIDGPTSPYTSFSVGQWVYIAITVDAINQNFTWYAWDPVLGLRNGTVSNLTGSIPKISWKYLYTAATTGVGGTTSSGRGWGVGTDGTNKYVANKSGAPTNQQAFSDLAVWNRALTASEITSIYQSMLPLSTVVGQ